MERNHLRNLGKGRYEEHFCDFFLNSDQCMVQEMSFKRFIIRGALAGVAFGGAEPFVQFS